MNLFQNFFKYKKIILTPKKIVEEDTLKLIEYIKLILKEKENILKDIPDEIIYLFNYESENNEEIFLVLWIDFIFDCFYWFHNILKEIFYIINENDKKSLDKKEDLFIKELLKKKTHLDHGLNSLKQQESVFDYLSKIIWNDDLLNKQFHQHMYEIQNMIDNILFWSICLDEDICEYFHLENQDFFVFELEEQLNDIVDNANRKMYQSNNLNLSENIEELYKWNNKITYFQNVFGYQLLEKNENKKVENINKRGNYYIEELIKYQIGWNQYHKSCFQYDEEINKIKMELEENVDENQNKKALQKMNQLQKNITQYRSKIIDKKLWNINLLDNQLEYILDLQRKYNNQKDNKNIFNFDIVAIFQKNKIEKNKKRLDEIEQKYIESYL